MRIALLSAEYPPQPGGIGDYTQRLGVALVDRGQHVAVLTIAAGSLQIIDLAGAAQPPIALPQADWAWRSWRAIIAALDLLRPEILHIQYQTGAYGMHPAINLLPWRLRGLSARPAVVVTAHDLLPPYLFPKAGPLRGWVTRRLLADADAVVVTNAADRSQIVGELRLGNRDWRLASSSQSPISNLQSPILIPIGSNIAVAPPEGYDRAAWRAQLAITPDQTLVAYFGLISRSKGLDVLLDALAQLPESVRLLVVGGAATAPEDRAYAAEMEQTIARMGLAGRVQITGHCPAAEVSAHLLAADLAALPFADGASFRRGSLLAALAHGLPVVTTGGGDRRSEIGDWRLEIGSTHHASSIKHQASGSGSGSAALPAATLADGENVLLTPPGDVRALVGAITQLAGDAALRARLAAGGRALAAQFGWPEIALRHEELYARLTHQRKAES